jgi:YD repeat-containing protein
MGLGIFQRKRPPHKRDIRRVFEGLRPQPPARRAQGIFGASTQIHPPQYKASSLIIKDFIFLNVHFHSFLYLKACVIRRIKLSLLYHITVEEGVINMRIIAVFMSALMLTLAACASTQSGGSASGGVSTSGSGGRTTTAGGGTAAGGAAAASAQAQRNSFKTRESVFFATGSGGGYTAGTLDEYTVFEWDSGFANVVKETRYSASDSVLEKIEYTYQGNNPATKITKIIIADERGREQEELRSQVAYQYAQGRLQNETLKNKDGNVITSYEYAYDGQGNRASRIMKNGRGIVMTETTYTYANGRLASAETKSASGSRISFIEHQYDAQGNLIKQETRNASGKTTSVFTAAWQNGLEMKNELTGADNAPQLRETNEYSSGDLIKKTIENLQGKSVQIIQYEYAKAAGR